MRAEAVVGMLVDDLAVDVRVGVESIVPIFLVIALEFGIVVSDSADAVVGVLIEASAVVTINVRPCVGVNVDISIVAVVMTVLELALGEMFICRAAFEWRRKTALESIGVLQTWIPLYQV